MLWSHEALNGILLGIGSWLVTIFVLFGWRVTVITDHKPIENIWKGVFVCNRTSCRSCIALDREITGHDIHRGNYRSRHQQRTRLKSSREQQMADHYVKLVTRVATPSALMGEQVLKCTYDDPTLQAGIQMTRDKLV